ncbi:MAG: ZIP family metal transporter [Candidatus Saccharimonadales bacterium]|nr:ZIP family metal transporter [Candidatus Saccharimonadales bacterium]
MSSLAQVIFYSLIGGVFSLIGGILLLYRKKSARALAEYATPFAAGALLAAAFADLLREASHQGSIETALNFTLIGILAFFLLERFLQWFHHHHEHTDKKTDPTATLIIVGDTIHNFIDGIAIAAGFLVSPETGIVVTLAVAAHEIPQEIGDFGLLLRKGLSRSAVLTVNIASAAATTIAAIIFFEYGQTSDISLDIILGLVAGFFIYIAVSDIIPSIHKSEAKRLAGWKTALLITGALVVSSLTTALHGYIEQGQDHSRNDEHIEAVDPDHVHDDDHDHYE